MGRSRAKCRPAVWCRIPPQGDLAAIPCQTYELWGDMGDVVCMAFVVWGRKTGHRGCGG